MSEEHETVLTMNANRHETSGPTRTQQITLRGPAELADALPFMLGFHPTDSVVLVALHGERGRLGGRVRLGIPSSPREWASTADHLAECLVEGGARVGARPDGIVVFLCQDPAPVRRAAASWRDCAPSRSDCAPPAAPSTSPSTRPLHLRRPLLLLLLLSRCALLPVRRHPARAQRHDGDGGDRRICREYGYGAPCGTWRPG